MSTYARRKGSDTWHWCRNCSNFPTVNVERSPTKPRSGELCNECQAKERSRNCS
jgi:hypothetical protein